MNESESTDEVTKSHKLQAKALYAKEVSGAQRQPVYWLCACRYSGDMNLMQAFKRELERSCRANLTRDNQSQKHSALEEKRT